MRLSILAVLLFVSGSLLAQDITYTVNLLDTKEHKVKVTLDLKKSVAEIATYQMPAWAPGAYAMTNYGRFVTDFKAYGKNGNQKRTEKVTENRWKIYGAKDLSRVEYLVGNSYKDSTSLYFALCHIDSNFFFANGTALFGYVNDKKNVASKISYMLPYQWTLHTGASPKEESGANDMRGIVYHYKNYDELADAPIMAGKDFQIRTFMQGGAQYDIVVASDRKMPMDSLEESTKKIVKTQTDFFGDTPFARYVFLINAPTFLNLPSLAQGALEHSNSSAYLLVNLPWETFKTFAPHIISHEFFHAWNVKRIHSDLLGPFDYTKAVKTTSLWLSEGITDYYSYTLLARNHLIPASEFYGTIQNLIGATTSSSSVKAQSLEELSKAESDFKIENASTFYYKGTLVGLMLDVEIRTQTNNARSLDDVMRGLYAEAKKGKHFKDKELIGKIEKIAHVDLKNFYKRYIAGTDTLPVEEYLNKMALTQNSIGSGKENNLQLAALTDPKTSKLVLYVNTIDTTSEYFSSGLRQGDILLTVNGTPLTMDNAAALGKSTKNAESSTITVERDGERKEISINRVSNHESLKRNLGPLPNATALQRAIRKAITGI